MSLVTHVPSVEANLVALALVAFLVLKVINGVAALSRGEFSQKLVVVLRLARLGHHNFRVVRRKGEDDVLRLLAQLQRLELLEALLAHFNTGRL